MYDLWRVATDVPFSPTSIVMRRAASSSVVHPGVPVLHQGVQDSRRRARSHGALIPRGPRPQQLSRGQSWLKRLAPRFGRGSTRRVRAASSDDAAHRREVFFPWPDLPEAIRFHILSYLDRPSLASLACVSRGTNAFTASDVVWRRLYQETFSTPPPCGPAGCSAPTAGCAPRSALDTMVGPLRGAGAHRRNPGHHAGAGGGGDDAASTTSGDTRGSLEDDLSVPPWRLAELPPHLRRPPRRPSRTPAEAASLHSGAGSGAGEGAGAGSSMGSTISVDQPRARTDSSESSAARGVAAAVASAVSRARAESLPLAAGDTAAAHAHTPPRRHPREVEDASEAHPVEDGLVSVEQATPDSRVTPGVVWTPPRPRDEFLCHHGYKRLFKQRLDDPCVGDGVQVLWVGSFNLVSEDGITAYEGRAWWEATVVDKDGDEYKIHYPQWDSGLWDEWVPRNRIRWPPARDPQVGCPRNPLPPRHTRGSLLPGAVYLQGDTMELRVGDVVEMRCSSSSGRSPWLESVVLRVEGTRYYVNNAFDHGNKAVHRKALRFVRRPVALEPQPSKRCSIM